MASLKSETVGKLINRIPGLLLLISSLPGSECLNWWIRKCSLVYTKIFCLSYDVAPGIKITPCNKIDKPLVGYRFSGNVMTSISKLRTYWQNYNVFTTEIRFQSTCNLNVIWWIESNIRALVLLNLLNSLQASHLISFPQLSFKKFNNTWALYLSEPMA